MVINIFVGFGSDHVIIRRIVVFLDKRGNTISNFHQIEIKVFSRNTATGSRERPIAFLE